MRYCGSCSAVLRNKHQTEQTHVKDARQWRIVETYQGFRPPTVTVFIRGYSS